MGMEIEAGGGKEKLNTIPSMTAEELLLKLYETRFLAGKCYFIWSGSCLDYCCNKCQKAIDDHAAIVAAGNWKHVVTEASKSNKVPWIQTQGVDVEGNGIIVSLDGKHMGENKGLFLGQLTVPYTS